MNEPEKLKMTKIEKGVMVMKDDLAWGVTYADGHSTSYGWLNPADPNAEIHSSKYFKKPTDATWKGSHYEEELKKGKLVKVYRITTVHKMEEL